MAPDEVSAALRSKAPLSRRVQRASGNDELVEAHVSLASMVVGTTEGAREALNAAGHESASVMPHVIFRSSLYDGFRVRSTPALAGYRPSSQLVLVASP
ncbi:hypothetical protein ABT124_34630 [Streptomyces sp. NPDC001982]|uniref:hypothetical protein n=1 Tax=unclassified Streptomyces TaxID=2593676 RepID=UPI00331B3522